MLTTVPFRPPFRRDRHEKSTPEPPSPVDSGYGSASPLLPLKKASPDRQDNGSSTGLLRHFDGNRSESDDLFVDSDAENTFVDVVAAVPDKPLTVRTRAHQRKRSASLPYQSPQSLSACQPLHRSSPAARLQQGRSNTTPLCHVDRFIPTRHWETNASERLRIHKEPHKLTPAERLVRNNAATEDPFVYRRRAVAPLVLDSPMRVRTASRNQAGHVLGPLDQNSVDRIEQQADPNAAWAVGLRGAAVNNGRGQLVRRGTNARLFQTTFPTARHGNEEELEKHKARLAAALDIDITQRVLDVTSASHRNSPSTKPGYIRTRWNGTEWVNDGPILKPQSPVGNRALPTAPFRVLDAPNLRDDFYCSILAYSATAHTLAVGLGNLLYGWSETRGVRLLNSATDPNGYLTSLSFSSTEGCKAILAFGRSDGTLGLLSLYDDPDPAASRVAPKPRFEATQPAAIACLSWKPVCTLRPSKSWEHPGLPVKNEDLLVGDETGMIYYYAVEWPERWEVERHNWSGEMTLLARIVVHTQQICGLAWSKSGDIFATGGNDNLCALFEAAKIEAEQPDIRDNAPHHAEEPASGHARGASEVSAAGTEVFMAMPFRPVKQLGPADARCRWPHGAAVKAIAFCPWQDSLVATGGGSNDKCIHFFHTGSGTALASISVSAQVTSLIWSTTRREIAATFGYTQPDHPIRIAVFSWPDCRQVAAVPWAGEHRALYAIPYPSGPRDTGSWAGNKRASGNSRSRSAKEGCIIVASSDKSVKFHEVWASDKKGTAGTIGVLGGSPILEFLEGIDREGEVIR
ncbi:hypothetical protein VTJ83DRAFT_6409 [Remersonia thermophila]|uniref:WD40 repeat-like protein n=1 Tax=Remersonia thermophila TaxID=72144 RepID=A0ABR4D5K4_9PEZI